MNCQQITDVLDDGDLTSLRDEQKQLIEAHVFSCKDCARDWRNFEQLRALPLPEIPSDLAAVCRARVGSQVQELIGRRSRLIVIGALVAFAAAAALLVESLRNWAPADRVADATSLAIHTPPIASPILAADTTEPIVAPAPTDDRMVADAAPKQRSASAGFTVYLRPMDDRTSDEASGAAVSAFRIALIQELRRVSGLALVGAQAGSATLEGESDYTLTIKAAGSGRDNRWIADVLVSAGGAGKGPRTTNMASENSVLEPSCSGQAQEHPGVDCSDPAGAAARMVELMRQSSFPPDLAWRQELAVRLRDRRLDVGQRFKALLSLRAERPLVSSAPGSQPRLVLQRPDVDLDVVRGAVELAASVRDPVIKAQIWRQLRGVRQPELIQPLIDSMRLEADDSVRAEAATTLAADFADDPKARAALESTARNEEKSLVRMLARRGIEGDAPWLDYVTSSLRDSSLTDGQRVEALVYLATQDPFKDLRNVLDADAIGRLALVLPRMLSRQATQPMSGTPGAASTLTPLLSALPPNQPAVTQLFIDVLAATNDRRIRRIAVSALRQNCDEPRVRKVLNIIASSDSDPSLRELAASLPPAKSR